ncbi:deaminase domain-containing protein, partial [Ralstonia nicotianae]
GGVISSTAAPSKNVLRTGTLTTRDVENHAAYSSEQSSVSVSYTSANPLNSEAVPTPMQQGVSNLASNAVGNAQGPIAGNASGTTRSAISAGTVVITDNAGQVAKTGKDAQATVAGLNRDTEHANDGAIGKIFDKQKVEEQQEIARLQAQVVQQAAPILYKLVGNFLQGQPTEVKVAVHALVGGLISRAMGGEFGAGAAGAGAATLIMETFGKELESSDALRNLSEKDRKALMQLVSGAIGGVVAGATSGSGTAAAAGGATSQMAEQFNRQLHPDEQKWIRDHAKEFARQQRISEEQAIERLSQQAAKQVDYLWRAQLSDGDDETAKAFLGGSKQTFTNQLGEQQKLFTATDQQLLRPEMFADTADPKFYQRFVQSGVSRQLNDGLIKELKDSGIDIKNGAAAFANAAKEHPGIVFDAAWAAVKGLPGAIVDGLRESGQAIGEGAAVALNKDLTDKLNAIYGTDVSGYQQALLAVRIALGLTGAATDAKVVTGVVEAAAKKAATVGTAKAAQGAEAVAKAGQEAEAAAKAGQGAEAVAKAGQEAEAVAKAGQEAEAAAKAGQGAEAVAKDGQGAEAVAKDGQGAETAAKAGQEAEAAAKAGQGAEDAAKTYLSNSTARDIQQRLADVAELARSGLPRTGNVAVAEVKIPALSSETSMMKAYSSYDEAINGFLPKPAGDMDTWLLKPSVASSRVIDSPVGYLRDVDTEFKILETVAQRLGGNKSASGVINLFSEKDVCPSCTGVIMQFRKMFPNIQLNVFTK